LNLKPMVLSISAPVRPLVLLLLLLAFNATAMARESRSNDTDQRAAQRADRLYAEEEFDSAYDTYLHLAKKGDPFSQYRTSFMRLQGQGVEPDVIEAFAWATLAAESGEKQLQKYLGEVEARVPEQQRDAAELKAAEYRREWGKVALAREARSKAKRTMQDCTGSRLGTSCDILYATQMPKFWNISPGAGNGADGGSGAPSGTVNTVVQGAGGEVRDAQYYRELRQYTAVLEQYIEQNAGTVEIRDVESVEPQAAAATADSPEGDEGDSSQPR